MTNTALPACSTQSSMAELFIASESHVHCPILGTQWDYAAIKQGVAVCSQTLFKCSIAIPLERVRVHTGSMALEAWPRKPAFQNGMAFSLLPWNQEKLS